MNNNRTFENPFAKYNANDMSDDKILMQWCDPYELLEPSDASSLLSEKTIFLEGGRGCGKTMLLRYLSFEVQRLLVSDEDRDFLSYLTRQGIVCFYTRIDIGTIRSFQDLRCPKSLREQLLVHYFELVCARSYIELLMTLQDSLEVRQCLTRPTLAALGNAVGRPRPSSLLAIQRHLDREIARIDSIRNNDAYSDDRDHPLLKFRTGALSAKIPEIIHKTIPPLQSVRFTIALDEYENFSESFQQSVNTLIRSSGLHVGFRLGMRFHGLKTRATVNENEFIKENNDFKMVRFKEMKFDREYSIFLKKMAKKRLESVDFFSSHDATDIESLLGEADEVDEALHILSKQINPLQHFRLLRRRIPKERINEAIPFLRCENNPLLEMLNILWVLRGTRPEVVGRVMQAYLKGNPSEPLKELVEKYKDDYVHKYKLSLLFLLASQYRKDKMYYGFNVFMFVSSGIPRNFINLCRFSFARTNFEFDTEGFEKTLRIPSEIQNAAAHHLAETELREIDSLPKYNREISYLVRNLGKRFGQFHTDPFQRYPENNTFYTVDLGERNQRILEMALTWSVIQRKPSFQKIGQSELVGEIFFLNRLLGVKFNLSYRVRGGRIQKVNDKDFNDLCTPKGLPSLSETRIPGKYRGEDIQSRIDRSWHP